MSDNASNRLDPADFNKLVDRLLLNESTIQAESQRDPLLHKRRGVHNETLLHFFVVESKPGFVLDLARLGAELDPENEFGNTPLMESIIKDDLNMVEVLLRLGANPNHQSSRDKSSPMHVAVEYERNAALELLLRAGGRTDLKNSYGETADDLRSENR